MSVPRLSGDARPRAFMHDGVRWSVRETTVGHVHPGGSSRCLIFESETVVRRVYRFPADWDDLDDGALWQVSLGR